MSETTDYDAMEKAINECYAIDGVEDVPNERMQWRIYERQVKNDGLEIKVMQIRFRAQRELARLLGVKKEVLGLDKGDYSNMSVDEFLALMKRRIALHNLGW